MISGATELSKPTPPSFCASLLRSGGSYWMLLVFRLDALDFYGAKNRSALSEQGRLPFSRTCRRRDQCRLAGQNAWPSAALRLRRRSKLGDEPFGGDRVGPRELKGEVHAGLLRIRLLFACCTLIRDARIAHQPSGRSEAGIFHRHR